MQGDNLTIDTVDGYRYKLKPFAGEAGIETALTVARILSSLIDGQAAGITSKSTPTEMMTKFAEAASFDKIAQHLTISNARPIIEHLAACTEVQTPEMIAAKNNAKIQLTDWSEHFRGRLKVMQTWLIDGLRWQLSDFFGSWLTNGQDPKAETQSPLK